MRALGGVWYGRVVKRILQLLVLLMLVIGSSSCRRHDYRRHVVFLPKLENKTCAAVVSNAVVRLSHGPNMGGMACIDPGKFVFNMAERTVTLEYDSMKVATKNIEHAIAKAGFAANEIAADADAEKKLPAGCR